MGSGSQSPRVSRPGPFLTVCTRWALALCLVLASSCSLFRSADFPSSLRALDSALASSARGRALDAAFDAACKSAASSSDWLSILKRAREVEIAGDPGRYRSAAARASKAPTQSEALAAATAHAFLRSGESARAFELFKGRLSPEARPGLWAETVLSLARKQGLAAGSLGAADFERLAALGPQPRLYLNAAVLYLSEGRTANAGAALAKAIAAGIDPGPELLWDAGRYEELAARREPSTLAPAAAARELALVGDASWTIGDRSGAMRDWERSISLDPRSSWKPYVKLAGAESALPGGGERATSYWSRMHAAFIAVKLSAVDTEALASYAAHLAREGEDAAALGLLKPWADKPKAGMLALVIQGKTWSPDRYASEALRFAASHTGDGASLEEVLGILARRGRFDDLLALFDAGRQRGIAYPHRWFYAAVAAAARGDYKGAAGILEKEGPVDPGPEAAFALGQIYLKSGDWSRAIARFEVARDSSRDGKERARALKALGRSLADSGDPGAAASAWRAASKADPDDPEAALLARDPGRRKVKVP
jgi:tetratricopeptide (TPR) repeat protein